VHVASSEQISRVGSWLVISASSSFGRIGRPASGAGMTCCSRQVCMSKDSDRFNLDRFGCDLPSRAALYPAHHSTCLRRFLMHWRFELAMCAPRLPFCDRVKMTYLTEPADRHSNPAQVPEVVKTLPTLQRLQMDN